MHIHTCLNHCIHHLYTLSHTHTHAHTRHLHPLSHTHTHTYTRTYTHTIVISLHRVCTPLLWHSLHPLSYLHNYITCTAHTHTHTHTQIRTHMHIKIDWFTQSWVGSKYTAFLKLEVITAITGGNVLICISTLVDNNLDHTHSPNGLQG